VNLTNTGTWRQPLHELLSVGPLQIRVKLHERLHSAEAHLVVAGQKVRVTTQAGWSHVQIKSILDHELLVLTLV
jgi:hypothetical protein